MMSSRIESVLIVGDRWMFNRTPLFVSELVRQGFLISILQKSFFIKIRVRRNKILGYASKIIGILFYHSILPVLIFRSNLVFVPASNNYDVLPVRFWTRFFRRPLLVDYYVSVYEWECLLMKITNPNSHRARFLRWSDAAAYQADFLMHFNRAEIRHLAQLLELPDRSAETFVCPLFTRFDKSVESMDFPSTDQGISFVWWGSLLPLHGLSLIVEAFSELAKIRSDFKLHLCFMSPRVQAEFLATQSIGDVPWLNLHANLILRDGSLPRFVNEHAHIGFSHFGVGEQADYVGSNKVAEAMSLGRTCLVSDATSNRELQGYPEVFFTCERNVASMVEELIRILDHPEELQAKGKKCRKIFLQHYSEEAGARTFLTVLNEIDNSLVKS